ncbi:phage tail tape measure protein [Xenophilus aerolatus]|nr:phage tail tape measure protein [Xenophilus aerolatus]
MASRSLGTLTLDLVAKIGGFEQGMDAAARKADKSSREIQRSMEAINAKAVAVGTALGQGIVAGFDAIMAKIPQLVNSLDALDDMAEKTGIATEALSGLRYAGEAAGTNFEQLGGGLSKLARNMAEAAGGNKEAIATFQALGVEITNTDGTLRKTDDVLKDVAQRFAGYEDGAGKAALAVRVFGKSGEDLIPILNQGSAGIARLTEEARKLGAIYDGDLAKAAADFNDNLTKIRIASEAASISISSGLIKSLANLSTEFIEAKKNGGLFAAGMQSYFSGVKAFWSGTLFNGEAAKMMKSTQAIQDYVNKLGGPSAGGGRGFINPKIAAPVVQDAIKVPKARGGGADTSAQEAAARLAADLDAIKNAQEALTNTYRNQERILEALRGAGLKDEEEYYNEKLRLLNLTTSAQEDALRQEITRMQQEDLGGKASIDNARKIADLQAKLNKVQQDGATAVRVLGIESRAAYDAAKVSILNARQAAQDFFDTTVKGFQRQVEGIGQGSKFREYLSGLQQIEDNYQRQRQNLQNLRAQAELAGTFTPEARKRFEEQLAIINEFSDKATAAYKSTYAQIEAASKDWTKGAGEALKNYSDDAANVAKQVENAVGNAFKGLEDALVDFVTTGKADFKSLVDSILKDIARIVIKQQITGPLAELLNGSLKGASSGSGGFDFSSLLASIFGGGKAVGGTVAPNMLYRVNENGPELFEAANGSQFLMTGNHGGNIVPNHMLGGGFTQTNTINVQGNVDRRTAQQITAELYRKGRQASFRLG